MHVGVERDRRFGLDAPVRPVGEFSASVQRLADACVERLAGADVALDSPPHVLFVPGRVEVLGKHTDYAGGRSLLAAVDRGVCIAARGRRDGKVVVTDALSGESVSFVLGPDLRPADGWARYPMTVARRIANNFAEQSCGATLAFASDLPPAAGMSSSSALIIAAFLAFAAVGDLQATDVFRANIRTREELAEYLAAVENGSSYRDLRGDAGVGTTGGSQDHAAILCAEPGRLIQFAFLPARLERSVPLPAGHVLVVAASGVVAEKAGGAKGRYNAAVDQMMRAAELWRLGTGRDDAAIGPVLELDPSAADRLRELLRGAELPGEVSENLLARVNQFIEESGRLVPAAADALARGDLDDLGALVDRSQELAITSLGNQVGETIELARSARSLGAVAASAFGAGYGGSVWALVDEAGAPAFVERWRSAYLGRFPAHAEAATFFITRPGPPACRLA